MEHKTGSFSHHKDLKPVAVLSSLFLCLFLGLFFLGGYLFVGGFKWFCLFGFPVVVFICLFWGLFWGECLFDWVFFG